MIRAPTLRRAVPSRGQARSVQNQAGAADTVRQSLRDLVVSARADAGCEAGTWGGAVGSRPCRRRRRRRTGEVLPPNSRRNANRVPCHGARTGGARAHLTAHAATLGVAGRSLGAVPPRRRATMPASPPHGRPRQRRPVACRLREVSTTNRTLIQLTCDTVLCPAARRARAIRSRWPGGLDREHRGETVARRSSRGGTLHEVAEQGGRDHRR